MKLFKQSKKMLSVLLLLTLLFVTGCSNGTKASSDFPDVVATVDGVEVSGQVFGTYYNLFASEYTNNYGEDALTMEIFEGMTLGQMLKDQILDMLVVNQIVINHMQSMDQFIDEDLFNEHLNNQKNAIDEDPAMKAFYEEHGATDDFYKAMITNALYEDLFYDWVEAMIDPDSDEAKLYYDTEVIMSNARHILVETQEEAEEMINRLNNGESFEALAKTYSTCPSGEDKGGELGLFNRGQMVPAFENVAFSLPLNTISQPVESQFGFHVIEVIEKVTISNMIEQEYDEFTIQMHKNQFIAKKSQSIASDIIEDLYSKSEIEILIDQAKS